MSDAADAIETRATTGGSSPSDSDLRSAAAVPDDSLIPAATNTGPRLRFAKFVLSFSMFVMGACGMIYEYVLGVVGNNLMGSSHEQIFVIIGLMMFAMGLGASIQQNLVNHLIDRFLMVELVLGLMGGISTFVIFASFAYTDSYRVVMYGFAIMIGALIGCEIPLLIRINTQYSQSLKANLSTILTMDYVGSLAGALLFTYVFLSRMSVDRISLVLGFANTLLALGGLVYFWPLVKRRWLLTAACISSAAVLAVAFTQSPHWMATLEQRCFEDPIVHQETSKYQHLVLTKRKDHVRLYLDGHLQFSSLDEHIYHELLVHVPMSLAAKRDRVLILGGGDGLALRDVLRYGSVDEVTLVDIDPAIVRLASENSELITANEGAFHDARVTTLQAGGLRDGGERIVARSTKRDPIIDKSSYELARVTVANVDADLFLREVDQRFDVILIDFPDPRSIELAKLYSVPFYKKLIQRLHPGGMVAIQSTSPSEAKRVFNCIGQTLQQAGFQCLPYHEHIPSFGDWGWYLAWNNQHKPEEILERLAALERLDVATRYITPAVMKAAFVFGKTTLAIDEPIQANTRWNPVVVQYHARDFRSSH